MLIFHRRIVLISLALLLLFISAFSTEPAGVESIRVGVLKHFPPQYLTNERGEPSGFAIDIIKEICYLQSCQPEFVRYDTWESLWSALENGQIDIIPNMGITEKREKIFLFSKPVETFAVSLFTRNESSGISSLKDLAGKKVATIHLNVGETIIKNHPEIIGEVYPHIEDAIFSLLSGNVAALIFPEPVVFKIARKARISEKIKRVGEPIIEIRRGITTQKGNEKLIESLNKAISTLIGSQRYRDIYKNWYGLPTPYWTAGKVFSLMMIILVLSIIVITLWYNRVLVKVNKSLVLNIEKRENAERNLKNLNESLEQRVEKRTEELQKALSEVKTSRVLWSSPECSRYSIILPT